MSSEIYGSFLVPGDRLADLTKAVEKMARRIEKGRTHADFPPTIEAVRDTFKQRADGSVDPYHWVTIRYQSPEQDGWHLVAVYDWELTPDGERVCYTSPVPGQMILSEHREVEPGRCDHCNINRARKKAMLITKDFLDYMVVGTSCIKDFLGHKSAQSFVDLFTFHKMLTDSSGAVYGGPAVAMLKVEEVVTVASMFVRLYGFHKSSNWEGQTPTAARVHQWFYPGILRGTFPNPEQQDEEFAADAIAYMRSQSMASDYVENVAKALDAGYITDKRIALVASVAGVWKREKERQAANTGPTVNEHVGAVKERIRGIRATVQRVRYSEGHYGTTSIITMRDSAGHCLVWFASGYHEVEEGTEWVLDGTVKKHDEFNGTKQTVLTRVNYTETEAA